MHQTGPTKERTILQYVTLMLDIYQVWHSVSHCAKFWELFLIKSGVKLNEQHCWDILLSQQILDAIKCVIDDNFVLQQDTDCTGAFNTVQLLQCKTLNFLSSHYSPELNTNDYEIQGVIQAA